MAARSRLAAAARRVFIFFAVRPAPRFPVLRLDVTVHMRTVHMRTFSFLRLSVHARQVCLTLPAPKLCFLPSLSLVVRFEIRVRDRR